MAPRFYPLTLEEFTDLLERFTFTRKIDSVHMHHTWRPNHAQYQGEKSIAAMWRYHTQEKKWSDIAQHVSIAPDGTIWTGRNWNARPVSATGHNGNSMSGPFMFEIIGDFDQGNDRLEGDQLAAVLGVIACVQLHFGLTPETLHFHNAMTTLKTCPGTSLAYGEFLDEVRKVRESLADKDRATPRAGKRAKKTQIKSDELIRAWEGSAVPGADPMDAEPDETDMTPAQVRRYIGLETLTVPAPGEAKREAARGVEITPDMLDELRPHVVNLNQGKFSTEGLCQTSQSDVDMIFEDHLERALAKA
ncbi:MAG: N-acetylmuramoyl-L-alanine amidase, partial [Armatimonadetes bacterium]|nr:N-acetylmuramoyl-L-alanine amidase [Akkermansiaceae bacterium]